MTLFSNFEYQLNKSITSEFVMCTDDIERRLMFLSFRLNITVFMRSVPLYPALRMLVFVKTNESIGVVQGILGQ